MDIVPTPDLSPERVAPLPEARPARGGERSRGSVPTRPGSPRTRLDRRRQPGCQLPRKEVIQPQLPLRLPCYDFVPITSPALDGCLPQRVSPPASGVAGFRDVTG